MNIKEYSFKIDSLSGVLMNNPSSMAPTSDTMKRKKIPSPEEEAAGKTYAMNNGQLYLPSIQFRQALLYAVSGKKVGKRGAKGIVAASVFLSDDKCPLFDKDGKPIKSYAIDTRRAVVQKNGVLRSRPLIEDWHCTVKLMIDTDLLSEKQVEENLNEAGTLSGVGDYRPSKGGWFGRFTAKQV